MHPLIYLPSKLFEGWASTWLCFLPSSFHVMVGSCLSSLSTSLSVSVWYIARFIAPVPCRASNGTVLQYRSILDSTDSIWFHKTKLNSWNLPQFPPFYLVQSRINVSLDVCIARHIWSNVILCLLDLIRTSLDVKDLCTCFFHATSGPNGRD